MTVDAGSSRISRVAVTEWVTAARNNEAFVIVGAGVLVIASLFFVLGVHGDTYVHEGGVPSAIAYLGSLAAQVIVVALLVITVTLYAAGSRWWRVLAVVAGVLM